MLTKLERKLIAQKLEVDVAIIDRLFRYSRKLRRIYELQCNGGADRNRFIGGMFTESEEAYDKYRDKRLKESELQEEKIKGKIADICKDAGLSHYHQTDPRGASLYIDNKPIDRSAYNHATALY